MAITQIIATLPAVLNDSETFYEDIAVRNNSLVTVSFLSINTWATQANDLAVEINEKALQVASQAVDGGYSQDYINGNFFSQDYINGNFFSQDYINDNFIGVNNAQDITEVKTFIASPIVPTPTTDHQVANKEYVDDNNKINTLTNKTTPVDADEIVIADSDSLFSLKKLSFTNLKAYFDSLYNNFTANDSRVKTALNASGTAPIYACRAWVNFDGTGTVAIRASGNVSSITDNGVGDYTVNFAIAMPDVVYSTAFCVGQLNTNAYTWSLIQKLSVPKTASALGVQSTQHTATSGAQVVDNDRIDILVFR